MPRQRKTDKARLKEGRGTGRGTKYKPWLKIREVPSDGRSHRVLGIKHRRIHQLFSGLEYNAFLLFSWENKVIEIREQFPLLPIQSTQYLAAKLNCSHPSMHGNDIVMTTDFLITIKEGNTFRDIVRTIKPVEKITERTLEKFTIEERYFKNLYGDEHFDWGVITEKEINSIKALNISNLFHNFYWDIQRGLSDLDVRQLMYQFKNILIRSNFDSVKTIEDFRKIYNMSFEETIAFIKYMIVKKDIKTNIEDKIIRDYSKVRFTV